MPHLELIAQLEEQITRLQEEIAVNRARNELIRSGQLGNFRAIPSLGNELGDLERAFNNLNQKIIAAQNQIQDLELQEGIIEVIPPPPEFIDPRTTITPPEQQNGINLKKLAIIGGVILLLS